MQGYRRISYQDRKEIYRLLKLNWSIPRISNYLNFHPSSIYREIKRNSGLKGYRIEQAQRRSDSRFFSRNWYRKLTNEFKEIIISYLQYGWTPEQVSERLKLESCHSISYETIYRFIYQDSNSGGRLFKLLPRHHRVRRKQGRKIHSKRGLIAGMRNIKERPKEVQKRIERGHWERDSMLGKNRSRSVLVAVERTTRFTVAALCQNHKAQTVHKSTLKAFKNIPVKSITNDQGREFALHKKTAKMLKTDIFFCDAGSPHQRGLNEGKIAILRRYIPKGTCLKELKQRDLQKIIDQINLKPMKCLGWLTPYEVFFNKRIALAC